MGFEIKNQSNYSFLQEVKTFRSIQKIRQVAWSMISSRSSKAHNSPDFDIQLGRILVDRSVDQTIVNCGLARGRSSSLWYTHAINKTISRTINKVIGRLISIRSRPNFFKNQPLAWMMWKIQQKNGYSSWELVLGP